MPREQVPPGTQESPDSWVLHCRLNDAVAHSQLAVDLATEQYKAGLVDFLSVLDAQRDLYANEDQLVQSQTSVTTNLVGLYRALGGGWNLGRTVATSKSTP